MSGSLDALKKFFTPHRQLLCALLLVGAVLRIVVHDVATYSPADEAHYVDITRWLSREGLSAYPQFVSTYLDRQAMWLSPTPLRWGYFTLTTLACGVHAPCDGRTIAWLSTLAGIASMLLTYALGKRLVGRKAALLATAFTIVSPLQLALGRRALQDEVYCAVFLTAFWALVRLLDEDPHAARASLSRRTAGFIAASTLAFAVKEAFVFPYAAMVALYVFIASSRGLRGRDAAVLVAPPVLFCAGFAVLGANPAALVELVRLNEASFSSDYSIQYQAGPAHRPLFDLFLLAPIVCLLATVALGKMTERYREGGHERWLGGFLILALGAFMGLPKNLRFVVILDPILRLLAAWIVVNHGWYARAPQVARRAIVAGIFVINAAIEFSLFETIFRQRNIYDPTTFDILRALGAIPRSVASAETNRWTVAFFLGLGGVVSIGLGLRRKSMAETQVSGSKESSPMKTPVLVALGVAALAAAFLAGRASSRDAGPDKPGVAIVGQDKLGADPMAQGLEALYTKRDPAKAVALFREVLATQPNHYGATFQLAVALEQAGDLPAARATWTKMLALAEANQDESSAAMARARLGLPAPGPTVVPVPALAPAPVVDDGTGELMRLGLAALYEKKDAGTAIKHFKDVLAKNPTHYGATYQLATALDQAGKKDEAKALWKKVLEMAEAHNDTETVNAARKRLGQEQGRGPIFGGFQ